MVFISGDAHGNFDKIYNFARKMQLSINNSIIILGDMGLCWRRDMQDFHYNTQLWESFKYKCKLFWLEGNHENYDIIQKLPKENNMRKCSDNIYMLERGQVYNFEGKKILTIGGADSVDKFRRIKHLSWWEQEQISDKDVAAALTHKNEKLDYVFSHAAPAAIVDKYKYILCQLSLDEDTIDHTSENQLEILRQNLSFEHWGFGHYHTDVHLDDTYFCLFNTFEEI